MKFKDYYATLGVKREATAEEVKTAYRRLARKFHPDVSKEDNAEAMFKEVAEAYETLKDPEKRAAYDQLGSHPPGQEFRPPPDWGRQFTDGQGGFDDIDLSDLFAGLAGHRQRRGPGRPADLPLAGSDYETVVRISFEQAFHGTEVDLELSVLEWGPDGDLYLDIAVAEHPLYRVSGNDLYIDLPLAPWEAVLGSSVELPTPTDIVALKVPAGTRAGQRLRLKGRGLKRSGTAAGHMYAVVRIEVPSIVDDQQKLLYTQLAETSNFAPRAHFHQEGTP